MCAESGRILLSSTSLATGAFTGLPYPNNKFQNVVDLKCLQTIRINPRDAIVN
jgi:hypothetical protein